eukprot:1104668-Rhodomonas_salina.2
MVLPGVNNDFLAKTNHPLSLLYAKPILVLPSPIAYGMSYTLSAVLTCAYVAAPSAYTRCAVLTCAYAATDMR